MSRKKVLIANWKLHHHRDSAREFFATLKGQLGACRDLDLGIAPVAPMLAFIADQIAQLPISVVAQNVFHEAKGAFTGEWAPLHLKEIGVRYCLVGHSERRNLFFETDAMVAKKAQACLNSDVTPVICIGETLADRESDQTEAVLKKQIDAVLELIGPLKKPLIFAYEPVWAIGTGKTATSAQAVAAHQFIRQNLAKSLGQGLAEQSRILYGGSVNAQNIGELCAHADVDGALVGGASLQAETFLSMVKALQDVR